MPLAAAGISQFICPRSTTMGSWRPTAVDRADGSVLHNPHASEIDQIDQIGGSGAGPRKAQGYGALAESAVGKAVPCWCRRRGAR
jgi:hypothetical protein